MVYLSECKFGDKLKTRKGLMAVYICHGISDKNTHICVVGLSSFDYEKIVCDRNGKTYLRNDDDRYDIVGKWEDEIENPDTPYELKPDMPKAIKPIKGVSEAMVEQWLQDIKHLK